MSLRKKINDQFNTALKNKNKSLISTFRLILAAIKEKDIANRAGKNKDLIKDPEIIKVLKKMKKQRQDSAELYRKGERPELLAAEETDKTPSCRPIRTPNPPQFSARIPNLPG